MEDALARVAMNLRQIRDEKGLTQEALAEAASMDPAEIRRIESAHRDPGVRVVARLAHGLGVPAGDLFAGID
jgi:transcriptional regulator with XRE-family HTH domain